MLWAVGLALWLKDASDFALFYDSALAYRHHRDLYFSPPLSVPEGAHNFNAPTTVLALVPFSMLPLPLAFLVWSAFSMLCAWLSVRIVTRELGLRSALPLFGALMAVMPGLLNLRLGQMGFPVMLFCTNAWERCRQGRWKSGGAVVGVLIATKVFLLPLGVLLILRRRWSAVAAAAGAAASVVGLGVLVLGVDAYRSWFRILDTLDVHANPLNASLAGLMARASGQSSDFALAAVAAHQTTASLCWLLLIGAVAVVCAIKIRQTPGFDAEWAVVLLGSLLVCPLGWVYYVPLALGPFIGCCDDSSRSRQLALLGVLPFCVSYGSLTTSTRLLASTIGSAYTWGLLCWWLAAICCQSNLSGGQSRHWDGDR